MIRLIFNSPQFFNCEETYTQQISSYRKRAYRIYLQFALLLNNNRLVTKLNLSKPVARIVRCYITPPPQKKKKNLRKGPLLATK